MFKERLLKEQPVVYHTLKNSLTDHKLAHAYLFVGPYGTPKKEAAFLLAQSLICERGDGFACEACNSCKRIASGNYADMIYLDGRARRIRKEDVLFVQQEFMKTGLEQFNQKIYIIDAAENATIEALNSLLKFLEEPNGSSTMAILLTEQSDRLLPTIRSRCQIVQFKALPSEFCYNLCVENGLDNFDSYVLSTLIRDIDVISQVIEENDYPTAREMFRNFLEGLLQDPALALIDLQNERAVSKDKNKQVLRFFLDLCILFFTDLSKIRPNKDVWYQTYQDKFARSFYNNQRMLTVFLENRDKLLGNSNINLVVDQLAYQIQEVSNARV